MLFFLLYISLNVFWDGARRSLCTQTKTKQEEEKEECERITVRIQREEGTKGKKKTVSKTKCAQAKRTENREKEVKI